MSEEELRRYERAICTDLYRVRFRLTSPLRSRFQDHLRRVGLALLTVLDAEDGLHDEFDAEVYMRRALCEEEAPEGTQRPIDGG